MSLNLATQPPVDHFHSETQAMLAERQPWASRATVIVLSAVVVSFLLWLMISRVDRVVSSTAGKIVVVQPVNVFQALIPSIIKTINVREGDWVDTDQLLATLDPTFAAADVKALSTQIANSQATVERDDALLAGRPINYDQSFERDFPNYASANRALFGQQKSQYQAQLKSFDAKISQSLATIDKFQKDKDRYQQRQDVAQQVENIRTELAEKGLGSQLNRLASQDSRLDLERMKEFDHNSLLEAQQMLDTAKSDREAFVQQWSTTLSQELVKARGDLDNAKAQLEKAMKYQDLVRIKAAEPSIVLTVAKLSVGSVLKEGDALFTLMPDKAPIEAEINVSSRDIGFIRPGDRCTMKIDAFNFAEHGAAEGRIRWISAGAFTTAEDGSATPVPAYYKARCAVDKTEFKNVPDNFRLIPGMTLSADLHLGTRSLAMYLLGGVLRGYSEAMREP